MARSGLVSAGMVNTKYVPGVIQEAVTQSVCMRLMRREPNMSTNIESRPVMNVFPEAYWVNTEAGDGGGVEPLEGLLETGLQGWTNATITAAKMGVVVPIAKDVIDDAASDGFDLWSEIKPRLAESIARKFDQAVLTGTSKPTVFPDDILTDCGTASTTLVSGSNSELVDLYDEILSPAGVFALCEGKGFRVNGIVADVSMMSEMRGVRSKDGVPLWTDGNGKDGPAYRLGGIPVDFPENDSLLSTSALMIVGDWKRAFYAWRKDIELSMSDTAMVTDATGLVRINAFQQDVVLLKAVCRIGWCCPVPADIKGRSTRYPFAALLPAT